jgi:glycosyltransferase involved in cell wall biosynthesis
MKMLIISAMPHHLKAGRIVGWGPTVEEIDTLADCFDEIIHVACLYPDPAPASAVPYRASNVRLHAVPPSGGARLIDKLGILTLAPRYIWAMLKEMPRADLVHVRAPANISLFAMVLLTFLGRPKPRWIKYAGNWKPTGPEPWSYRFQRWWLEKGFHRGTATVNGRWPEQPDHVFSFLNPSFFDTDLAAGRQAAGTRHFAEPYRLLFVGRIESPKGVGRLLQIAQELQQAGFDFTLDLVGDGPELPTFEQWSQQHGLDQLVTFHGWQPKHALPAFYAAAHFLVLPTTASEGWPKVLSEAMAYGVVPLASAISSIPQILAEAGAGPALPPEDPSAFSAAIQSYAAHPETWKAASEAGLQAASWFSYAHYLEQVRDMFRSGLQVEI